MNKKIPNQNEHHFRFTPATEPVASERLEIFRSRIKEFQKRYPEFLGATLCGSMARGNRANANSDIDALLFIDGERLPSKNLPEVGDCEKEEALEDEYLDKFFKELNIPEDEISKYHIDVRLISSNSIDYAIEELLMQEKKYKKWKLQFDKEHENLSEEEKDTLIINNSNIGNISSFYSDEFSLFHARIGTGIEKYRHLFLEKIYNLSNKKTSEYIWESIYYKLLFLEQGRDLTIKINIPKTLNEAIRVYHPDLYKKIDDLNKHKEK